MPCASARNIATVTGLWATSLTVAIDAVLLTGGMSNAPLDTSSMLMKLMSVALGEAFRRLADDGLYTSSLVNQCKVGDAEGSSRTSW